MPFDTSLLRGVDGAGSALPATSAAHAFRRWSFFLGICKVAVGCAGVAPPPPVRAEPVALPSKPAPAPNGETLSAERRAELLGPPLEMHDTPLEAHDPKARVDAGALEEPSKLGEFKFTFDAPTEACSLWFQRTGREPERLFDVQTCSPDSVGLSQPQPWRRVGDLAFPYDSAAGVEYHLFGIAAARGGNAIEGNQFWVIVLTDSTAWFKELATLELSVASVVDDPNPGLVLVEAPTTTSEGVRVLVTPTKVEEQILPRLPSRVIATERRSGTVALSGPFHVSNYRPVFELDGRSLVLDHDGSCRLPAEYDGLEAFMTFDIETWSDGREESTCVKLTPITKGD